MRPHQHPSGSQVQKKHCIGLPKLGGDGLGALGWVWWSQKIPGLAIFWHFGGDFTQIHHGGTIFCNTFTKKEVLKFSEWWPLALNEIQRNFNGNSKQKEPKLKLKRSRADKKEFREREMNEDVPTTYNDIVNSRLYTLQSKIKKYVNAFIILEPNLIY